MRLYLLPIGILLLGVAAALPFRRDRPALNDSLADVSGAPKSVAPLAEQKAEPLADPYLQQSLGAARERFARQANLATENPYEIPVPQLPASYDEVAIPLVLDHGANNLLRGDASSNTPQDFAPKVAVDRFGIPRPIADDASLLASQQSAWSQQLTVQSYDDALTLATDLDKPTSHSAFRTASEVRERKQQAAEMATSPPSASQAAANGAAANETLTTAQAAETVNEGELPAPKKQERKRFVIREPK